MALQVADRIKETSTTTGTGALTLAGAMTGFRAFSAVCTSPSDTCYYVIEGVDASGNPTGEWECGLGTYSASNTLTRTTPQSSSNAGSVVTLSAGTKRVWIDTTASYLALLAKLASPTLTTPTLGVATATSINKWAFTAPSTAATMVAGADSLTYTMPIVSALIPSEQLQQGSHSAAYTLVLADANKQMLHPAADTNARTFTIDSNANVAYPVGTAITFVNETSQVLSIAITTDTMTLANSTTTGTRSLAQNGIACALKVTSTKWIIAGTGLT